MAYNEALTEKVREALAEIKKVEEKKMFRGVTFMVNKKMFMTVGDDELMIRVHPDEHEAVIEKYDGRAMIMKGKVYRGYIYVHESKVSTRALGSLVKQALSFNELLRKKK